MEYKFAKRMDNITASEVREILKVAQSEDFISFAGGLPAAELFPYNELSRISADIMSTQSNLALQYSVTEGYVPLRRWIADRINKKWGVPQFSHDNILITSGSQSGLDLAAKLFLDDNDCVLCEEPTYLAAINAFKLYKADFLTMPCDSEGVIIEGLEDKIKLKRPKAAYVIPVHQNPSGRTWSAERCRRFMEIMTKYEIPVIEDCAYFEINFKAEQRHISLAGFDPKGLTVSLGSFSKVLAPGLRVAWISADKSLISKLAILKQITDLQTPYLNQLMIYGYVQKYDFDEHVAEICRTYKARCEVMIEELKKGLPEGVKFTEPDGGMFIWVMLPDFIKGYDLFKKCIQKKVALVTGTAFYPSNPKENRVRFNFSNMPFDKIRRGISIFCEILAEEMSQKRACVQ